MTDYPLARALLAEYGIEAVPPSAHPKPGTTKAIASIQRIISKRGMDHARLLMTTWRETNCRNLVLDEASAWAMSDLIIVTQRHFPEIMEKDIERWFSLFDSLPMGWLWEWSRDLTGLMPRRYAIVAQGYERVKKSFGIKQGDLFNGKRVA